VGLLETSRWVMAAAETVNTYQSSSSTQGIKQ
jgi:hypothetical protein